MRKILFALAAVTICLLGSCSSSDENLEPNAGKRIPIQLSVYQKTMTRADVTSLNGSSFMLQAILTKDGTKSEYISWTTVNVAADGTCTFANGNTYYWPQEGTLTFYAYAYDAAGVQYYTYAESSTAKIDVTGFGNVDLVVANTAALSTPTNGTVSLTFGHALSKLNLKVVGADADATYTLYSIEVKQSSVQTYTYGSGWTAKSSGETGSSSFVFEPTSSAVSTDATSPTTVTNVQPYFVPQTDLEIGVAYMVEYSDGTLLGDFTGSPKTAKITLEEGKSYNLTLTLSYDKPISYSASVNAFTATSADENVE